MNENTQQDTEQSQQQKVKIISDPNISMSYEDIAKELGLTVKQVKDAEKSALKKLRHPRVGKGFKNYLGLGETKQANGF